MDGSADGLDQVTGTVYMRCTDDGGGFKGELLFMQTSWIHNTARDVFDGVGSSLKRAEALLGKVVVLAQMVLQLCRDVIWIQCLVLNIGKAIWTPESSELTVWFISKYQQWRQCRRSYRKSRKAWIRRFVKVSTLNDRLFAQLCYKVDPGTKLCSFTWKRDGGQEEMF